MDKKTLYCVNKSGGVQQWSVWTEGDTVIVEHGKLDGKLQRKETVCTPKNQGRANETTPEQQAQLEAQSKWNKQYDKYYRETVEEARELLTEGVMLAQDYTKKPHFLEERFYCSRKIDGCFSYGVTVITCKGLLKIGDIVENKIKCKVLSFNEETGKLEYKQIKNYFNNGEKPKGSWFNLVDNGKCYGITKNHRVYTGSEWASVEDTATVVRINPLMEGIITGMLLGDSCAAFEKRNLTLQSRPQWRLMNSTSYKDVDYGREKVKLLEGLVAFKEREFTSGYGTPQVGFTSKTCADLPYNIGLFYNLEKTDKVSYGKRVEHIDGRLLQKYFTDESLVLWYLDDGSLNFNNGNENTPRLSIEVARYSDETIKGFISLFKKKYGVTPTFSDNSKVSKVSKRLDFNTRDSLYLLWRMSNAGGNLLPRKFPKGLDTRSMEKVTSCLIKVDNTIKDTQDDFIRKETITAYDIEVEGNHNYFANGVLVHNCRVKTIFKNGEPEWHSRGGKTYPVPKHLITQLKVLHDTTGVTSLDGEAFVSGYKLQKIQSCVKKPNSLTPKVTYEVFDVPMLNTGFADRNCIMESFNEVVVELPHINIVQQELISKLELEDKLSQYLSEGFEGIMLRNPNGLFEFQNKRSNDLLKYKLMSDSECKVLSCQKDKNGQGLFTVEWTNPDTNVKVTFELSMNGSHEENTYEKLSERLGEYVNFKYQDLTEDGVPTFARGLYFRECDSQGNPVE